MTNEKSISLTKITQLAVSWNMLHSSQDRIIIYAKRRSRYIHHTVSLLSQQMRWRTMSRDILHLHREGPRTGAIN